MIRMASVARSLAYVRLDGQGCLYNVWEPARPRATLQRLLQQLRTQLALPCSGACGEPAVRICLSVQSETTSTERCRHVPSATAAVHPPKPLCARKARMAGTPGTVPAIRRASLAYAERTASGAIAPNSSAAASWSSPSGRKWARTGLPADQSLGACRHHASPCASPTNGTTRLRPGGIAPTAARNWGVRQAGLMRRRHASINDLPIANPRLFPLARPAGARRASGSTGRPGAVGGCGTGGAVRAEAPARQHRHRRFPHPEKEGRKAGGLRMRADCPGTPMPRLVTERADVLPLLAEVFASMAGRCRACS